MTKKQKMQRELQDWFEEQKSVENELYEELDRLDFVLGCQYDCFSRACDTCGYREAKARAEEILAVLEALDKEW